MKTFSVSYMITTRDVVIPSVAGGKIKLKEIVASAGDIFVEKYGENIYLDKNLINKKQVTHTQLKEVFDKEEYLEYMEMSALQELNEEVLKIVNKYLTD